MASITKPLITSPHPECLRPFDVRRDLASVADLVELCFADTLDPDGERYLQQMRAAAQNPGYLRWAAVAATAEWASVPLTGYVWEQDGRLVGNISLIPYNIRGRRHYLIANVGVHPDYRRRGIARSLTIQAIEHARARGAPSAWLHVGENNFSAIHLYETLGFVERARRTTWFSSPELPRANVPPGVEISPRQWQDWEQQKVWMKQNYPTELTWHLPLNLNAMRPGPMGVLHRLLNTTYYQHWVACRNGQLLGTLTWQASASHANILWLAAPSESEVLAANALLLFARQHLSPRRSLSLDYPAHQAEESIQVSGFIAHQTLIWMEKKFN